MANYINIPTRKDSRGVLSVIDSLLPFEIKRVYYVYDSVFPRGGHSHKYSSTFLVALNGKIVVTVKNKNEIKKFELSIPSEGLLITPGDWISYKCDSGAVLLCLSSHPHHENDYVYDS
jgi:hypothetical protein